VLIAHLRGDCIITGNIADFTRSVRVSPKPNRNLSGNQGASPAVTAGGKSG